MAKLVAPEPSVSEQTVVEQRGDGTTVVHRHVKEWQPQAPESLREIEATIDSWGMAGSAVVVPDRHLDLEYVTRQVDRITRRVRPTRKEVVTETVTEWVEGPVGSGPINVEEPAPAGDGHAPAAEPKVARPKRRLPWFGSRKAKADAAQPEPVKAEGAKGYQPQCAALTADGAQCRNSARHDSKYCISHFGYQPPTVKGLAQRIEGDAWDPKDQVTDRQSVASVDTRPAVAHAKDTRLRTRRPAQRAKGGRRRR